MRPHPSKATAVSGTEAGSASGAATSAAARQGATTRQLRHETVSIRSPPPRRPQIEPSAIILTPSLPSAPGAAPATPAAPDAAPADWRSAAAWPWQSRPGPEPHSSASQSRAVTRLPGAPVASNRERIRGSGASTAVPSPAAAAAAAAPAPLATAAAAPAPLATALAAGCSSAAHVSPRSVSAAGSSMHQTKRARARNAAGGPPAASADCTKGETSGAAPARPETRRPVAKPLRPLNISELEILTLSASARAER